MTPAEKTILENTVERPSRDWRDLSDDELRHELRGSGCPARLVGPLVRNRLYHDCIQEITAWLYTKELREATS